MVGDQFARAALTLVESQPLTAEALGVAVMLAQQASTLNPQDAELCRLLFKIADLAEDEPVRRQALGRLVKLAPHDDVVRLLYVTDAIERYQTVEDRLAAYRKLLAEPTRQALGATVASRLASDYAWLLNRTGDVDGFAKWIAEAVALDPSNRAAVATAVGFFRMNVGHDPFAEAELLTTLLLADPISLETQSVLARLLLENGAYASADRIYGLAARNSEAQGSPPAGGLLADRAVAQWGHGDPEGAMETVKRRQREIDEPYRTKLRREDPDLTPLELARRHAPITSTLATVRAAIQNRRGDAMAGQTLEHAINTYEIQIGLLREQEDVDVGFVAKLSLEAAFVTLWLGGAVERAQGFLDGASEVLGADGLSAEARARFEGWMALRSDDPSRAVELLEPIADGDRGARVGLALALLAQGQRRDAARSLLQAATEGQGTLMGVWSADVLAELLGRELPPTETANRLDELVASIPAIVDRLPEDPRLAVSLRVLPAKTTFDPYEPVIINLEITNNAPFPLAIDARGPIQPQVALTVSVQVSRSPELDRLAPMIVDIDRRLRLEPRERLVIPVDLRRGSLASVLNRQPLRGATIKIKATMAFYLAGPDSIRPGMLGSQVETPPIRIDGIRLSEKWIFASIADVLDPDSTQDLRTLVMLSQVLSVVTQARERNPLGLLDLLENPRQVLQDASAAITEAYAKLDPVSRAWILGSMSRAPVLDPVYAMARKDDEKVVRIAYLLYCLAGADDPMIDAARRGDDADVRRVAEMMHARIERASASP